MKRFALLALLALGSVCASAQMQPSYQGLWWNSPGGSESGWGLNITHQGDILFATWFTYDADGKGMWLVIPRAELQPGIMDEDPYGYGIMYPAVFEYDGPIYRTTGPAFDAAHFDAAAVVATKVGDARLRFTSPDEGTFSYIVNGLSGGKSITRQVFGAASSCTFGGTPATYQDLWWRAPANSESGWGLNLAQQGNVIFATWFTYGADGKGLWLVASEVRETSPGVWSGALYSTTGPAYNGAWDASKVKVAPVGSMALTFDGMMNGTLATTVNGATITQAITRQVFASPASTCR